MPFHGITPEGPAGTISRSPEGVLPGHRGSSNVPSPSLVCQNRNGLAVQEPHPLSVRSPTLKAILEHAAGFLLPMSGVPAAKKRCGLRSRQRGGTVLEETVRRFASRPVIDQEALGHDSGLGHARQLVMSMAMTGPGGRWRRYCSYLSTSSSIAWSYSEPDSSTRAVPSTRIHHRRDQSST